MRGFAWWLCLLAVPLVLWLRRRLRWRCPFCGQQGGVVVDDLWDRQWRLTCQLCGHNWEERC